MAVREYPCKMHHNVLSEDLLKAWGHLLPEAYYAAEPMALLGAVMADSVGSPILTLPFDCMAEAEALGAQVTGYEDKFGLRAQGHLLKDVEELAAISFDGFCERGRIGQILSGISRAAALGYTPCINLSGYLTVADILVSIEKIFLSWRGKKNALGLFFQGFRNMLTEYATLAQQGGAKVISYGDPLAAASVAGPRMASEISRDMVVPLLRQLLDIPGGGVIHLCGKTSYALEAAEAVAVEELSLGGPCGYQEAVSLLAEKNNEKIILGHGCLNHNKKTDRLFRLRLLG